MFVGNIQDLTFTIAEIKLPCKQWRSQNLCDGKAHYSDKILSIGVLASSYVHLLKDVVYMKMYSNSS